MELLKNTDVQAGTQTYRIGGKRKGSIGSVMLILFTHSFHQLALCYVLKMV